jgi:hypothetical protein
VCRDQTNTPRTGGVYIYVLTFLIFFLFLLLPSSILLSPHFKTLFFLL